MPYKIITEETQLKVGDQLRPSQTEEPSQWNENQDIYKIVDIINGNEYEIRKIGQYSGYPIKVSLQTLVSNKYEMLV